MTPINKRKDKLQFRNPHDIIQKKEKITAEITIK